MCDTSTNNNKAKLEPKPATMENAPDSGNDLSSETLPQTEDAHPSCAPSRAGRPEPDLRSYYPAPPPSPLHSEDMFASHAAREPSHFRNDYLMQKEQEEEEEEELLAFEACYQRIAETCEQMNVIRQGIVLCQKQLELMGDILMAMEEDYARLYHGVAPAWPWCQGHMVQYPAWPW